LGPGVEGRRGGRYSDDNPLAVDPPSRKKIPELGTAKHVGLQPLCCFNATGQASWPGRRHDLVVRPACPLNVSVSLLPGLACRKRLHCWLENLVAIGFRIHSCLFYFYIYLSPFHLDQSLNFIFPSNRVYYSSQLRQSHWQRCLVGHASCRRVDTRSFPGIPSSWRLNKLFGRHLCFSVWLKSLRAFPRQKSVEGSLPLILAFRSKLWKQYSFLYFLWLGRIFNRPFRKLVSRW